ARPRLADQLGGAEDRGSDGDVRVRRVSDRALRRPSDAPRVEERRLRPVESPVVVGALLPEIESGRSLDEEGPLLAEIRLDVAQVDDGWVDFDLAEVRIHGRVECELAPYGHAQVAARRRLVFGAATEGIARDFVQIGSLGREIRQHLDRTLGM